VQVISNEPTAAGLHHATAAGVPAEIVDHRDFRSRPGFEAALNAAFVNAEADMIVLAGFMRVLTADFVDNWTDRLINVHPSLLPAFPGRHAVADALAAGVKVTGTTIHFVREAVDDGPVIAQAAVPVLAGDDIDHLSARIRDMEHKLLPHCIGRIAKGKTSVVGKWVHIDGEPAAAARLTNPLV
jgi:phosphoribosylglycinamide formyltransferase-1